MQLQESAEEHQEDARGAGARSQGADPGTGVGPRGTSSAISAQAPQPAGSLTKPVDINDGNAAIGRGEDEGADLDSIATHIASGHDMNVVSTQLSTHAIHGRKTMMEGEHTNVCGYRVRLLTSVGPLVQS
jgi:hypothetical protein